MRPVSESPLLFLIVAAMAAALSSGVIVLLLMRLRVTLDTPNDRSLHDSPTPRSGGLGILAGTLLGAMISIGVKEPAIWIALGLALLSFADDRINLPVAFRLAGHLVAAAVFTVLLGSGMPILLWPVLVLGLCWMTNLYNFMDGADGLAGGMTLIGFAAYGITAGLQGHVEIGVLSMCVASAAAGFLVFNFPPARIFMGDVGSIPIGFLAGSIGLLGWREGAWPLIFPLIVFAPFIVDATVTLTKRSIRRERVWNAHREHYYQRLILGGWSHRRAAIAEYLLMIVCAVAGLLATFVDFVAQVSIVAILMLVLIVLTAMIDRRWPFLQRRKAT